MYCMEAHIHVIPQGGFNQILLVLVDQGFSNMQQKTIFL